MLSTRFIAESARDTLTLTLEEAEYGLPPRPPNSRDQRPRPRGRKRSQARARAFSRFWAAVRLREFRPCRALALVPRLPGPESSAAAARALPSRVPAPRRAGFRDNTAMCSLASGAAGGYPWLLSTLLARRAARGAGKRPAPPGARPGCRDGTVGPGWEWGRRWRGPRGSGEEGGASPHSIPAPRARGSRWLASVRGRADDVRVLGGRGAVEDEDDLPELSDSGDEAAWEDEDDAEPPHDKQQTPCLFCDRFVRLRARRRVPAPGASVGSVRPKPGPSGPRILEPVVWSEGLLRRKHRALEGRAVPWKPRCSSFSSAGLSFPVRGL